MKRQPLTDEDIASRRVVSRRSLLGTIGIGAAAIAASVGAGAAQQAPTPKPADPCRDTDTFVNDQDGGCPGKPIA